jgi:hypothetical protein
MTDELFVCQVNNRACYNGKFSAVVAALPVGSSRLPLFEAHRLRVLAADSR